MPTGLQISSHIIGKGRRQWITAVVVYDDNDGYWHYYVLASSRRAWNTGWGGLANVILQSEKKIIMSYLHVCWKCWNSNWLETFWEFIFISNKCNHMKCKPRLFFLKHSFPKMCKTTFKDTKFCCWIKWYGKLRDVLIQWSFLCVSIGEIYWHKFTKAP